MNSRDNRSALDEGSRIGVYEVRALIGRDYLSLTYKAWNHHLNTPVLLREYFPFGLAMRCADGFRLESASDPDRERYANGLSAFLYQAEKLSDIDHAAIPKVLNALEFNDTGYQVTSFEHGQSLSAWLESGYSFQEDQLRILFEALVSGLKAVHERGLAHGMIDSENIFLRDTGDPMLINFSVGLRGFPRNEGELSGQPREAYLPAEQRRSNHCPVPADDLYALAATLYRCIAGRAPVPAPGRLKMLENGGTDPMAELISSQGRETPAPWFEAVYWMLRPEAKDRPQRAGQVETFLAERAPESQPGQQPSRSGTFGLAGLRNALTRTRLPIFAAVAVILAVMSLSVRNYQIPDFLGSRDASTDPASGKKSGAGAPVTTDRSHFESDAEKPESASAGGVEKSLESTGPSASESEYPSVGSSDALSIESNATEAEPPSNSENDSSMPETAHAKPQAPLDTVESDQLARTISGYLAAAEKNLAAFNLTTPETGNAYSNYQAVLGLDPDNREARSGINRILDRYVRLIESALQRGSLRNAGVYLARAESIATDSRVLDSVRSRLTNSRQALSNRP
ncbi:MAG: protein kinase domain-containing protein [Methylococcales bacterium]